MDLYKCRWLEGDAAMHTECDNNPDKRLDTRDEVILSFANALLKRTLSESFVGVRIADGEEGDCDASTVMGPDAEEMARREFESRRQRLILSSRSLSLELQKQKHRIAAQLVCNFLPNQKREFLCKCLYMWTYISSTLDTQIIYT